MKLWNKIIKKILEAHIRWPFLNTTKFLKETKNKKIIVYVHSKTLKYPLCVILSQSNQRFGRDYVRDRQTSVWMYAYIYILQYMNGTITNLTMNGLNITNTGLLNSLYTFTITCFLYKSISINLKLPSDSNKIILLKVNLAMNEAKEIK